MPLTRFIFICLIGLHRAKTVFGGASDEPRFVEPMKNVTVVAGRDVKLTCVVDNLGTYKIAWIAFDKSAILTVQDTVITRNPRINVTYDGYRTWTLHIERVNASDAGTYMCQVNTIVARSHFGIISVVVPPNIVDSESSGDVMFQEGANVTLVCSATGTPVPSITWRREDKKNINVNRTYTEIEYIGAELKLSKLSRTDMGAYLCIARNGVPPIVSKRIQVSVDFPPMMTIPHQLVSAPLDYSITLECSIEAHPQPLTYWTKGKDDSAMLHQSLKYHIEDVPDKVCYRTIMKLTIRNLKDSDFGTYKCVAKNSRGETEGEMKLYKSDSPTTTLSTPPSYFDKIFKGNGKKAPNSLNENYIGEEKVSPDRESGYPYLHKPREPVRFGEAYDTELGTDRAPKLTKESSRKDQNTEVEERSRQRDSGQFIMDLFNAAPRLELGLLALKLSVFSLVTTSLQMHIDWSCGTLLW